MYKWGCYYTFSFLNIDTTIFTSFLRLICFWLTSEIFGQLFLFSWEPAVPQVDDSKVLFRPGNKIQSD